MQLSQPDPLLDRNDNNETYTTHSNTATKNGHLTTPFPQSTVLVFNTTVSADKIEQSGTGKTPTSLTVRKLQTGSSFSGDPTQ